MEPFCQGGNAKGGLWIEREDSQETVALPKEKRMKDKVNILGTEYAIHFGNSKQFPGLDGNDGYTDSSSKEIVIDDMQSVKNEPDIKRNLEAYQKQVLRHEIVHAFLEESGLSTNAHSTYGSWASNEEMVDWFAIQSPKIFAVYKELDIL